ncbi:hypothetical protein JMUB6875_68970 [Nocardia sp. JMUB6875]
MRPGSQETTHRSPPTQRAMCEVKSLVIIDAETTSIATDLLPSYSRQLRVLSYSYGNDEPRAQTDTRT